MTPASLSLLWISAPCEYLCRHTTEILSLQSLLADCNISSASLRSETLLVTESNYFNVSIKLENKGDDSYNTNLTMHYPPGLSFSMMKLTTVI